MTIKARLSSGSIQVVYQCSRQAWNDQSLKTRKQWPQMATLKLATKELKSLQKLWAVVGTSSIQPWRITSSSTRTLSVALMSLILLVKALLKVSISMRTLTSFWRTIGDSKSAKSWRLNKSTTTRWWPLSSSVQTVRTIATKKWKSSTRLDFLYRSSAKSASRQKNATARSFSRIWSAIFKSYRSKKPNFWFKKADFSFAIRPKKYCALLKNL